MRRLKIKVISIVILAVLVLPATASGQNQDPAPAPSPEKTLRTEEPQPPRVSQTKYVRKERPVHNHYIVVLEDDVAPDNLPVEVRRERVTAIAESHAKAHGGTVGYIYETVLRGYSITLTNEADAIAISKLPRVRWVEQDAWGTIDVYRPSPEPSASKGAGCNRW